MEASQRDTVDGILSRLKDQPGALLPILHEIQERLSYIPPGAIPSIASALQSSSAEVAGTISFYRHFRTSPPGRNVVQICRGESCRAAGADALEARARTRLGIDYHETTGDGSVTLEPVYCLGHCACSPAIMVGDEPHARVTPERLDGLLDECGEGR